MAQLVTVKEVSQTCTGFFSRACLFVTVVDMNWCIFQHLTGGLIQFQCSVRCNSEVHFGCVEENGILVTAWHSYINNSWKLQHSGLKMKWWHMRQLCFLIIAFLELSWNHVLYVYGRSCKAMRFLFHALPYWSSWQRKQEENRMLYLSEDPLEEEYKKAHIFLIWKTSVFFQKI